MAKKVLAAAKIGAPIKSRKSILSKSGGSPTGKSKSKAQKLFDAIDAVMDKHTAKFDEADHAEFDRMCNEGDAD